MPGVFWRDDPPAPRASRSICAERACCDQLRAMILRTVLSTVQGILLGIVSALALATGLRSKAVSYVGHA